MCPFSILAFLQPTTVDKEPKDNGIVLKEYSYKSNESLEDYFKRVTGGEGIA